MIRPAPVSKLIPLVDAPTVAAAPVPFGQYQGRPLRDVPPCYLLWFLSQDALVDKHRTFAARALCHLRREMAYLEDFAHRLETAPRPVPRSGAQPDPYDGSDLV